MLPALDILLVEDNPTDVLLAKGSFEDRKQFELTVADRLSLALELLSEHRFDIVLLDLGLPDSQGLETLKRLRQNNPNIPVIIMTARDDETLALQAAQEGSQDYLVKSQVQEGMLSRAIRYAIERHNNQQLLRERAKLAALTSDIMQAFNRDDELREMLRTCLVSMIENLDSTLARVWTYNPHENVLELQASAGVFTHIDGAYSRVPVGTSEIGIIGDGRMPLLINDVTSDERIKSSEWLRRENLVAFAGCPLLLGDRLLGVVGFYSRQVISDVTWQALASVAIQMGMGIRRKLDEKALKEREELFRGAFEHTAVGMLLTDPANRFVQVNESLAGIFGYSRAEMVGMTMADVTHPDDLVESFDKREKLLAGEGNFFQHEKRYLHHDGHIFWGLTNVSLVRDAGLKPLYYVGQVQDVTEQKRAEEERHRLFVESLSLLGLLGFDGRIVQLNPSWARTLGYTMAELMAEPYMGFVHSDDHLASLAQVERMASGAVMTSFENRLRCRDGSYKTFLWNGTPLLDQKCFSVSGHDITEQKRSNEALRLRDRAIQSVSQGIIVTDALQPDNPIVYVSPGFLRLSGYKSEEVMGRNCRFLQGADTDRAVVARIREAVRGAKPCKEQLLNYRKDGTAFWNDFSLDPVMDEGGALTHFIGLQTDATERRSLEDQFRQAQKMEAFGQLAGGVAHDFNNLLTIISGYSDIILSTTKQEDTIRQFVTSISEAGERAASLTRQLLAFSRKSVLAPKVVDLNEVVREIGKMLRRLIGEDILLTKVLDPTISRVKVDPDQLGQVLMNLTVNSRDAMPRGGNLTIETKTVELNEDYARLHSDVTPGKYVLLSMSDSGSGMTPEVKARLFEPFFTTKGVGKGTGLGLAVVMGIVKQSGGHVAVYSEPDHGTTFKLYFPAVEELADDDKRKPDVGNLRGMETVLLVEDDGGVRGLAFWVLQTHGYKVLAATDGKDAMRVVAKHQGPIDILVTDVVMPGMGGREVADGLQPRYPQMKVLYTSGYTDDAVVRHGIVQSESAFLQKPYSPQSLAKKVRQVLEQK